MLKKMFSKEIIRLAVISILLLFGSSNRVIAVDQTINDGKMKINNVIRDTHSKRDLNSDQNRQSTKITSSDQIFSQNSIDKQKMLKQENDRKNTTIQEKKLFYRKLSPAKNNISTNLNKRLFMINLNPNHNFSHHSHRRSHPLKKILKVCLIIIFVVVFILLGIVLSRKRDIIRRYIHL